MVATERQSPAADLDQAGRAGAQHLHPAANANAQLAQPTYPGRLAGDVADLSPFAGAETFEREEEIDTHETPREEEGMAGLLRLNLNLM